MRAGGPIAGTLSSLALCALALGALAGCGEDGTANEGGDPSGVGPVRAGSVAPLAQCSDWLEGNRAQRLTTIHDIREQLNQTGAAEPTSDLGDENAYALLQRACANEFAAGFRLYKLYARAAAFAPLTGEP